MGPSSVKSFIENPIKMTDETLNSFKNITNALIKTNNFCNFYQSSSSEMYGYDSETPFDEISEFKPNTPYAKAKLEIHNETLKFIEKYDWKIISGIMFNHESEFRTSNFLVMNLVENAIKIKNNNNLKLSIPSLEISRDWTYAQETCEGIFQLIENNHSGTFVIGSGVAISIKDICKYIFEKVDLNFEDFIDVNPASMRSGEPIHVQSNPKKIKDSIGWFSKQSIFDVIDKMFVYKNL
jgi:GDPmannose 4,6-dehydratase